MKKVLSLIITLFIMTGMVSTIFLEVYAKTPVPDTELLNVTAGDKSFTVEWKKAGKNVFYQVQYTAGKFVKGQYKNINIKNNKKTSRTIKKLAENKKYKVRIRTYKKVNSKKVYSDWSKIKKVKTLKIIKLKKISVTPDSVKMTVGSQVQLHETFTPSNATYKEIVYTSSNPNVAEVSESGLVTLKSGGNASIKVKVKNTNITKTVKISVIVPVTGVKITTAKNLTLEKGKTLKLTASVYPENATNKKIIWSSSDKNRATVNSNGVVTALIPSEYVLITATSAYNKNIKDTYVLKTNSNSGFLTKSTLDSMNLLTTKNLMIVAHPDDETFWGGAHLFNSDYLENTEPFKSAGKKLNSNYLVVVLTNGYNKTRSADLKKVMESTNDKFLILSYPDVRKSWFTADKKYKYEVDSWTTCQTGVQKDIELLLNYKKWDVVVTHNPDGEYNKSHHKIVNNIVTTVYNNKNLNKINQNTPLFYFGHYYSNLQTQYLGTQISAEDALLKDQLVAMYTKVQGSVNAFKHMFHNENWIWSEKWAEAKANKFNLDYIKPSEEPTAPPEDNNEESKPEDSSNNDNTENDLANSLKSAIEIK